MKRKIIGSFCIFSLILFLVISCTVPYQQQVISNQDQQSGIDNDSLHSETRGSTVTIYANAVTIDNNMHVGPMPFVGNYYGDIYRMLFQWDISSIPDNATITSTCIYSTPSNCSKNYSLKIYGSSLQNVSSFDWDRFTSGKLYRELKGSYNADYFIILENGSFKTDLQSSLKNRYISIALVSTQAESVYGAYFQYSSASLSISYTISSNNPTPTPVPCYMSYPEKYYKDITGDGNNDLIAISGVNCYVVPWRNGIYDYDYRQYMNAIYFTYPWKRFEDINNDGYSDYIGISSNDCYVVPGTSTGMFDYNARNYMNAIYFNYPIKTIKDMNGDGYLDFVSQSGPDQYIVPGNSTCLFDYDQRIYIKLY